MGILLFLLCLFLVSVSPAQTKAPSVVTRPSSFHRLPSSRLVFSEPSLDAPLDLPYTLLDGSPVCGPESRTFIEFMASPPMYNNRLVFSISAAGKVTPYRTDQLPGLRDVSVVSMDPGVLNPTLLVKATTTGLSRKLSLAYHLVLFDFDGKLASDTKLDLPFEPSKVAQLTDNSFLMIGTDNDQGHPMFVIVDAAGNILRDLAGNRLMPTEKELMKTMRAFNFAEGVMSPENLGANDRISAVLGLLTTVHSERGVLVLIPGGEPEVIEIRPTGETRVVKLSLPEGQAAESLITASNGKWFARTFVHGDDNQSNLYQISAKNGRTIQRIETSGVPASSITCASKSGFYGLRWIEKRAYLLAGDLK